MNHGFGAEPETRVRSIDVEGQVLRVGIRPGKGLPLVMFNGIGASFELLAPFTEALGNVETIVFDAPGVGGSPLPRRPYLFSGLARLVNRMLEQLGYKGRVDVLGVSWGGAAAQQFAYSFGQRCRRLILAATTPGVLMVPGRISALRHMFDARRYEDLQHLSRIAHELYGGALRRDPELIMKFARHMRPPNQLGYLYQQIAFLAWTSLPWLTRLRQPTLVLAGNDDPLAPESNARIISSLIPNSRLHVVDDGHLLLISSAAKVAPIVRDFLTAPGEVD